MDPKISVIVPVYNAERFIEKCIKSILAQKFTSFELILINDGSVDKSGDICEKYKKQDRRISYYKKENGGASSARNVALSHIKGEFITFVDADDYIKRDYLSELVKAQEKHDSDWTACSYKNVNNAASAFRGNTKEWDKKIFITGEDKIKKILSSKVLACPSGKRPLASPCCKLYRTSVIRDNNLKFDEDLKVCEDQMFNLEYIKHIKSFFYINRFLYIRNINEGSLFTGFRPHMLEEMEYLFKVYKGKTSDFDFEPVTQHQFILDKIREIMNLYVFHKDNKEGRDKVYKKFWCFMDKEPLRGMWKKVRIMMYRGKKNKVQVFAIKSKALWLWPIIK